MRVGFAQLNPTVGDLRGNFEKILQSYERLAAAGAELIVTPELAITGYPPQDLVFKSRFVPETLEILDRTLSPPPALRLRTDAKSDRTGRRCDLELERVAVHVA